MLTNVELDIIADHFADRFSRVNSHILMDIGKAIKKTGELTPSQARKLQQMYTYGTDLYDITLQLSQATELSIKGISAMYETVAKEGYDWAKPFYKTKGITQIPFNQNLSMQSIVKGAVSASTSSLINMSRTTAVGIKTADGFINLNTFYQNTISDSITAVATGALDYNSVIRQAIKDLGASGLRVQYGSGHTRRLDTAVRQNVLDGVRYIAQEISLQNGRDFGADGVELSAHELCAPDHLPYQGKQFSNKEFADLQQTLKRPIGEWNCKHHPYPIILGISKPAHTNEELTEMERYSNEKIEIDDKEYTRYECSQLQRKLETQMRYTKDEQDLANLIGDGELKNRAREKLRLLTNKYTEISKKAGLPTKLERAKIIAQRQKNPAYNPLVQQSLKRFTKEEINTIAKQTSEIAKKHVEKESKWSGRVVIDSKEVEYGKLWNCNISVSSETSPHILLHEQLHAMSISHYDIKTYMKYRKIEEGAVQLLTQEISKIENVPMIESAYDEWVNMLKDINKKANLYATDYEFAQALFRIGVNERIDWLEEKVYGNIKNITVEEIREVNTLIGKLR